MAHLESDGCVGQLRSTTRRCSSDAVRWSDEQRVGELQPCVERFSELEGTHVCECSRPILILGFTQVQNVYITEINGIAVVLGLLLEISCKKRGIILYHK